MAKVIAVIGALDTKQEDIQFIKDRIQERGYQVLLIDTGILGESTLRPDVLSADIAQAGGTSLQQLREKADRGRAIEVMCQGIPLVVSKLYEEGKINAVLGIGGGAGTAIVTAVIAQGQSRFIGRRPSFQTLIKAEPAIDRHVPTLGVLAWNNRPRYWDRLSTYQAV